VAVVRVLFEHKAKVDARNDGGFTALFYEA
jgi:hypothetical protein